MSLPPTQNVHDGAGRDDGSLESLSKRCKAYITDPYSVPPPNDLLPSGAIQTLLKNEPWLGHDRILTAAVSARVIAHEPSFCVEITSHLLEHVPKDEILPL